jgi:DNA-nicking Smr family endonuclease
VTERARRRRLLTEAEIELWRSVARTVAARKGSVLPESKVAPPPPPPAAEEAPAARAANAAPEQPPPPGPKKPPPLAPFEKRYRRQVTRGQVEIEAAMDLHGMNQAVAHDALQDFLRAAHQRGAKLVLVVTGKGRSRGLGAPAGESERGVLRRAVPLWLRSEALRGIVLGFEEAGLPHGGVGALYVRLRRRTH